MLCIAGDPSVRVVIAIVIVVPIPFARLNDAGGSESDQGQHEAAAHKAPRSRHSCISHVVPFFFGSVTQGYPAIDALKVRRCRNPL
jgi:hypothetical protein